MELHNLACVPGSTHSGKRVGRGLGSGMGKTSTRGQKGAGARSGGAIRPGFEGGQLPLYRRFPKRGFTSLKKHDYITLDVTALNIFEDGTEITDEILIASGLVKNIRSRAKLGTGKTFAVYSKGIKIIGNGEVTKKLTVKVSAITSGAKASVLAANGTVETK